MIIKTRFSPGDAAWARIGGLPRQVVISEIHIWSRSEDHIEIIYTTAGTEPWQFKESDLAATKKELFTL